MKKIILSAIFLTGCVLFINAQDATEGEALQQTEQTTTAPTSTQNDDKSQSVQQEETPAAPVDAPVAK